MTGLYTVPFIRVMFAMNKLRDEVTFVPDKRHTCLLLTIKVVNSPKLLFPRCDAHPPYVRHLSAPYCMRLGARETDVDI